MQTKIHPELAGRPDVELADEILRSCVHCGFCNATCPTYQVLGDERDGPRGRIYLIKQLLETGEATGKTQQHLDRCLSCRACETTCPSGVRYAKLADVGRHLLEERAPRTLSARMLRRGLRAIIPWPRRFRPLLRIGQLFRPLLPGALRRKIPRRQSAGPLPTNTHSRRVILLGGCVQSVATPRTNAAAARVLDRLGISAIEAGSAGCCGAMSYHLSAQEEARAFMRRNIDAWRPYLESAEAVVSMASGCGAMLADYAHVLRDDPDYADAARMVSDKTRDLSEVLLGEDLDRLEVTATGSSALHCPCTLTHALKADVALRQVLERLGVKLAETRDDHLCCGSAGSYSILQPGLSLELADRKLAALCVDQPQRILTGNIGCQLHLGSRTGVPVQHWIELLDKS